MVTRKSDQERNRDASVFMIQILAAMARRPEDRRFLKNTAAEENFSEGCIKKIDDISDKFLGFLRDVWIKSPPDKKTKEAYLEQLINEKNMNCSRRTEFSKVREACEKFGRYISGSQREDRQMINNLLTGVRGTTPATLQAMAALISLAVGKDVSRYFGIKDAQSLQGVFSACFEVIGVDDGELIPLEDFEPSEYEFYSDREINTSNIFAQTLFCAMKTCIPSKLNNPDKDRKIEKDSWNRLVMKREWEACSLIYALNWGQNLRGFLSEMLRTTEKLCAYETLADGEKVSTARLFTMPVFESANGITSPGVMENEEGGILLSLVSGGSGQGVSLLMKIIVMCCLAGNPKTESLIEDIPVLLDHAEGLHYDPSRNTYFPLYVRCGPKDLACEEDTDLVEAAVDQLVSEKSKSGVGWQKDRSVLINILRAWMKKGKILLVADGMGGGKHGKKVLRAVWNTWKKERYGGMNLVVGTPLLSEDEKADFLDFRQWTISAVANRKLASRLMGLSSTLEETLRFYGRHPSIDNFLDSPGILHGYLDAFNREKALLDFAEDCVRKECGSVPVADRNFCRKTLSFLAYDITAGKKEYFVIDKMTGIFDREVRGYRDYFSESERESIHRRAGCLWEGLIEQGEMFGADNGIYRFRFKSRLYRLTMASDYLYEVLEKSPGDLLSLVLGFRYDDLIAILHLIALRAGRDRETLQEMNVDIFARTIAVCILGLDEYRLKTGREFLSDLLDGTLGATPFSKPGISRYSSARDLLKKILLFTDSLSGRTEDGLSEENNGKYGPEGIALGIL